MKIINSTEFLRNMAELYEKAGWDPNEVHFSLMDLIANIDNEPKIVIEATNANWIPVTEKLPDKDGNYLACLDNGDVGIFHYFNNPESIGEPIVDNDEDFTGVVAWMPLPEPYRRYDA